MGHRHSDIYYMDLYLESLGHANFAKGHKGPNVAFLPKQLAFMPTAKLLLGS